MKKTIGILLGCLCILLLESGVKRIEKKPALTITPSRLQLFVDQHTDPYTDKNSLYIEYTSWVYPFLCPYGLSTLFSVCRASL